MDIVLCDDHEIVLASIADLLEAHGHHVAGRATHPAQLSELVDRFSPDVCVLDLLYEGEIAPEDALPAITDAAAATDVIVLTGVSDPDDLEAARRAGAAAVGSKALPWTEILALIEGRSAVGEPARSADAAAHPFFLTDREVEVLQCLGDGACTAQIAELLDVRQATARSHVQSVLHKLGVHSRLAAVAVGIRYGLVEVAA